MPGLTPPTLAPVTTHAPRNSGARAGALRRGAHGIRNGDVWIQERRAFDSDDHALRQNTWQSAETTQEQMVQATDESGDSRWCGVGVLGCWGVRWWGVEWLGAEVLEGWVVMVSRW